MYPNMKGRGRERSPRRNCASSLVNVSPGVSMFIYSLRNYIYVREYMDIALSERECVGICVVPLLRACVRGWSLILNVIRRTRTE